MDKKFSACYATAQTSQGQELHCDLVRNHKERHQDYHVGAEWDIQLATNPWAVVYG